MVTTSYTPSRSGRAKPERLTAWAARYRHPACYSATQAASSRLQGDPSTATTAAATQHRLQVQSHRVRQDA